MTRDHGLPVVDVDRMVAHSSPVGSARRRRPMTRITPEISRRILELGARGFTLAAIGHELVLARSAVSKHLKDHGRARGIWWKTDDEVENAICRRYVEGLKKGPDGVTYASVPLAQLGREFDRSPRVVLSILRRRGVETATSKARWGDIDHRFFARVRRPDQAYFLGLLAADGNVTDAGYVQIKLKARDRDVLEKLKAALRSEHRLGNYIDRRKGKVVGLCFKSPWMAKDLARYGIVPRKSLAEEPWRDAPRRLLPHAVSLTAMAASRLPRPRARWGSVVRSRW